MAVSERNAWNCGGEKIDLVIPIECPIGRWGPMGPLDPRGPSGPMGPWGPMGLSSMRWGRQNQFVRLRSDCSCLQQRFSRTLLGTQRYTPPLGLGLEKIGKWLVWTIWWCIYKLLYFTTVCIYTTKSSTPAISLFFRPQLGGGVYLWGPNNRNGKK